MLSLVRGPSPVVPHPWSLICGPTFIVPHSLSHIRGPAFVALPSNPQRLPCSLALQPSPQPTDRDELLNEGLTGEDGNPYGRWSETKNIHPTVKPTDLMKYLIRLVTPKDGVVLDPFMGSGSTGKAAKIEGFDFIGIELDEEYFQIAQARIDAVEKPITLEEFFLNEEMEDTTTLSRW